jgi:hypothetical protein
MTSTTKLIAAAAANDRSTLSMMPPLIDEPRSPMASPNAFNVVESEIGVS